MKARYIILILILTTLLILTGCEKSISGPRFNGDTYSLAGLLVAGSPIDAQNPVYITKSSTIEDFNFLELFVFDAEITIFELDAADTTATLLLEPILDLGTGDSLPIPKIKYVDPTGHIIKAGTKYRIEARIPGYDKLIWAETTVPGLAEPVTDFLSQNLPGEGYSLNPATTDSIPYPNLDLRYPLALNTGDFSGTINLFVEVFCMEEFSTDLEWTIPIFGITNPDSSIAWIYNSSGDSMRRITVLAQYQARFFNAQGGNFAVLSNFAQDIAFFGRYRFTIYSVDDNFFRYKYSVEGYLNGGVHNALGYFGSAAGGKLYTRVVKGSN